MAQPALHKIEGDPFFDTGHAKPMPQAFGARLGAYNARSCHDLDDAGVGPTGGNVMEWTHPLYTCSRIEHDGCISDNQF